MHNVAFTPLCLYVPVEGAPAPSAISLVFCAPLLGRKSSGRRLTWSQGRESADREQSRRPSARITYSLTLCCWVIQPVFFNRLNKWELPKITLKTSGHLKMSDSQNGSIHWNNCCFLLHALVWLLTSGIADSDPPWKEKKRHPVSTLR